MKTYASKDLIVEKQDIGYEVMDVDTEQRRERYLFDLSLSRAGFFRATGGRGGGGGG